MSVTSMFFSSEPKINGLFVAGGVNGTILVSNNLENWTLTTISGNPNVNSLAYGNGIFVAGTSQGIYSSTNGTTWTLRYSTTGYTNIRQVVFNSNAVDYNPFYAIFETANDMSKMLTSANGTSWILINSGITGTVKGIVLGNVLGDVLDDDDDPYMVRQLSSGSIAISSYGYLSATYYYPDLSSVSRYAYPVYDISNYRILASVYGTDDTMGGTSISKNYMFSYNRYSTVNSEAILYKMSVNTVTKKLIGIDGNSRTVIYDTQSNFESYTTAYTSSTDFQDIASFREYDVIVGASGTIVTRKNGVWTTQSTPTTNRLMAIAGYYT